MNEIRLTDMKSGEWVYCVDSPDKGDRVRISSSESAIPVHVQHWAESGKWIYIDRIKTIHVGDTSCTWMGDGSQEIQYNLLKIDVSYGEKNWLFEIRSTYYARYIKGGDNSPSYGCELLGPYSLIECFGLILQHDMVNDLMKVSDPEVSTLALRHFCHDVPRKNRSWLDKIFN